MDFGVSNTLKFAPSFISIHPPLDFTVKYQFLVFLAHQNVGSCKVAIWVFFSLLGTCNRWKLKWPSSTMEWEWKTDPIPSRKPMVQPHTPHHSLVDTHGPF